MCRVRACVQLLVLSIAITTTDAASLHARPAVGDEEIQAQQREKQEFLSRYRSQYGYEACDIDELYAKELAPRADGPNWHYLDYTAANMFTGTQMKRGAELLQSAIFGNPHSLSSTSVSTSVLVDGMREKLLHYFGASSSEYELVFTRSGTGALQLVGESFPWTEDSTFVSSVANHNSVLGIREYACAAGARISAVQEADMETWLDGDPDSDTGPKNVVSPTTGAPANTGPQPCPQVKHTAAPAAGRSVPGGRPAYSLLAYPALDNYNGVIYPLRWVTQAHARSTPSRRWLVLLDTAAYVSTHRFNLTEVRADFAVISFYKMFGWPTGIGALFVHKDAAKILRPKYWGGGAVFLATGGLHWTVAHPAPARLESGTLPFLEIISLQAGLDAQAAVGGLQQIGPHAQSVADYTYRRLISLTHSNGAPLVAVTGKWRGPAWTSAAPLESSSASEGWRERQGAVVNFQVLQPDGQVYSYQTVGTALSCSGIQIRWGCTCNPGSCYNASGVTDAEVRALAEAKAAETPGSEQWEAEWQWINVTRVVDGRNQTVRRPLASLRASFGWLSRFEDAYALWRFINGTYRDAWDKQFHSINTQPNCPKLTRKEGRLSAPVTATAQPISQN